MKQLFKPCKICAVALSGSLALMSAPAFASNEAMMDLLKVLRDQGTISEEAYTVLKNSAQADAEQTEAKIEETAEKKVAAVSTTSDKLKWAEKIQLKGDLRLRWQHDDVDLGNGADNNNDNRNRFRYRYRLGIEGQVLDNVKVGAGIASGSDDPRSTNETFDDSFETKDARIDYAFAEWKPREWVSLVGGKFKSKDYLWTTTDLLWDSDINPEGFSVHLQNKVSDGFTAYGNAGHWILDEFSNSADDPNMSYFQVGGAFGSGRFFGEAAATYYAFDHFEGEPQSAGGLGEHSAGGNTLDANGNYQFDYDSWGLSAEAGINDVLIAGKSAAVFADYIKNTDSDEDTGYALGFWFGDAKVKERGQWQFRYIYADLEEDAFPDIFPDSDRLGGATGLTSNELAFELGVAKNWTVGVDYYDTENEQTGNPGDEEKILQLDTVFKF